MRRTIIFAFLATCLWVTGCASTKPTGAIFSPQPLSSNAKALVYFFRPLGESFGYDRTYFLAVNERKVVDLVHGGYIAYETNPGNLMLLSDVNRTAVMAVPLIGAAIEAAANPQAAKLEIDVEPGKTYYVRMRPESNFTHFAPRLSLVSEAAAKSEISRCKLIINKP